MSGPASSFSGLGAPATSGPAGCLRGSLRLRGAGLLPGRPLRHIRKSFFITKSRKSLRSGAKHQAERFALVGARLSPEFLNIRMTTRNIDIPSRRKTAPSVQAATSTLPVGMNRHGETSREQRTTLGAIACLFCAVHRLDIKIILKIDCLSRQSALQRSCAGSSPIGTWFARPLASCAIPRSPGRFRSRPPCASDLGPPFAWRVRTSNAC